MSSPPVAVNPADILSFADSLQSSEDKQTFIQLYHNVYPGGSPGASTSSSPRFYIVQQPIPRKHRRSYIEVKDLKALCSESSHPDLDTKDTVMVMHRVPDCVDSAPLKISSATSGTSASDRSVSGSDISDEGNHGTSLDRIGTYSQERGSALRSIGDEQVAAWLDTSSNYMNQCFSMSPGEQAQAAEQDQIDIYADSEDEDEDTGSENSGQGQSKRTRRVQKQRTSLDSNRSLPEWFRPLVRNGEVQFEIWVVAFVNLQVLDEGSSGKRVAGVVVDGSTTVTTPGPTLRQAQHSDWVDRTSDLLESRIMHCFVREQVAVGRIGIDFRRILEEEKESRKPRRCIR
ncbi:hypothetical protein BGZ72_008549 [Mortierella alpina]|nr:hypothetical protein BGZ72_008549 [Mortierella alpina]